MNILILDNDHQLKKIAQENIDHLYYSHLLYTEVEYSLSKLLEKELELVKDVEIIISDLKTRYDFDISVIFSLLDQEGTNDINKIK